MVHTRAWSNGEYADATAGTDDEFMVRGPGSGPVTLIASLELDGAFYGGGVGTGLLRESSSNQSSGAICETGPYGFVSLTVQTAIGRSFPLHYEVGSSAHNSEIEVQMIGRLGFYNLPAGVTVTPCRHLVTPVRPRTWGQIRKIYR